MTHSLQNSMKQPVLQALTPTLLLTLWAVSATANAQSYSIDWHTLDGGGGTSTGGVYSVTGTLGQPDATLTSMDGGNFSITGGFWALFAVQTPGAPPLSVQRLGGAVRVFWPKPAAGYVLDQSLTVTGAWSQVPLPYTTSATDISVSVPSPVGNRFYRLRLQ